MKKDNEALMKALGKKMLKAKGQEFVLDSQIKVLKEQRNLLKNDEKEYDQ